MIVDASAVLAILRDERGADKATLHAKGSAIGAVNLAEVLSKASDLGMELPVVRRQIDRLEIAVEPLTSRQAEISGALRRPLRHGGISLGDRACLALGVDLRRPIVTADRKWAELELDLPVEIILIR